MAGLPKKPIHRLNTINIYNKREIAVLLRFNYRQLMCMKAISEEEENFLSNGDNIEINNKLIRNEDV